MPIRWRCGHGGPDVKFEEIGKVTLEMTTHVWKRFCGGRGHPMTIAPKTHSLGSASATQQQTLAVEGDRIPNTCFEDAKSLEIHVKRKWHVTSLR